MHHHFDYDHVAELRGRLIPYEKVEKFVRPQGGDVILDIGAGDGFYSVNFARLLTSGKVIALEVDERGTELLRKKMADAGVSNIDIVLQDACDEFQFKGYSKVFFSNTFHDIKCNSDLIARFSKEEAGLEVVLIEFKKEESEFGPPIEIRISEDELEQKFTKFGFRLKEKLNLQYHYIHKYVRV